jgi:hypothetical protein
LAIDGDSIAGALPIFIKQTDLGNCINSLPYYGSNGGIVEYNNNNQVKLALLNEFDKLANDFNCVSGTIITSPFEENTSFYEESVLNKYKSVRIGQITTLANEDQLWTKFHSKTRNVIRKAIKSEVRFGIENTDDAFSFLIDEHISGMSKIGALPKEKSFFDSVRAVCQPGKDFNVYVAYSEGKRIAALLLFYFNKTVEYYTPVTKEEYRIDQPMSLLVFEAMKAAWNNGFLYWNWGGTHITQTGVYDFKKKWGTDDFPYYYYTCIYDKSVCKYNKEDILLHFNNYFVIPFENLES